MLCRECPSGDDERLSRRGTCFINALEWYENHYAFRVANERLFMRVGLYPSFLAYE